MKLSICILGIPERMIIASKLINDLCQQAGEDVEILYFLDNKNIFIGNKRRHLVSISSGEYICFIDDDDSVEVVFIQEILNAIELKPDIVTFNQLSTLCYTSETSEANHIPQNRQFHVNFSIFNENEDVSEYLVKRKPFHMCPVKREIVEKVEFPTKNVYNEDWIYMSQVLSHCKTEFHIDKILHYYNFNEETTATQ